MEDGGAAGPKLSHPAGRAINRILDRAFQRLPHTPCQGNADESPEQRRLGVEPAEPDAYEPEGPTPRRAAGRLKLGDLGLADVPFRSTGLIR